MGSRKHKKIVSTQKRMFLCWYKGLSINDKIAFKTWIYYWGRGRDRLITLFSDSYWWNVPELGRRNAIEDGYVLLWSRPWPDLQRWSKFVPR